ncbi:MAG: CBS domain-containing protein [Phycisphaerales bacterium]
MAESNGTKATVKDGLHRTALKIGAIMTRHVVTVSMDDTLERVQELFKSFKFHHLIVVEHRRVVGVVSDRDLLKSVSPFIGTITEQSRDRFTLHKRVHQVMTRRLVSVTPETTLADASQLMLDGRVNCLPVLDAADECVGVVTMRDLLSWALVECAGGPDACTITRAA